MKILISIIAHDPKVKVIQKVIEAVSMMTIPSGVEIKVLLTCQDNQFEIIKEFQKTDYNILKIFIDKEKYQRRTSGLMAGWDDWEDFILTQIKNSVLRIARSYDALLFVDGDIVMPVNALEKFVDADKDVVGGWCFSQRLPSLYPLGRDKEKIQKLKGNKVFEVNGIPIGCMLIKKKICEQIQIKFNRIPCLTGDAFFKQVQGLGHKLYLHPEVYVEHIGEYTKWALEFKKKTLKELSL